MSSLGIRNVVLASAGTDGTDGPTDAAGAVVDGGTIDRLPGSAEEAMIRHDAYNYLIQYERDDQDGDDGVVDGNGSRPIIMTGPTGTNVADVCVTLVR